MGQLENIDRLRKKRNRRKNIRRLGTFLSAVVFVFALWYGYQQVRRTSLTETVAGWFAELGSGSGFPLDFSGVTVRQTEAMGNTLLVLTDTHLHIYNRSGKELRSVQHNYPDPVLKCSGSRILLYDTSSRVLRVESKTKTVREITFDEPVLFAALSEHNDLAVITNAQRYLGQLLVYDNSMLEPVFSWKSAESYLYGAAFAPDGESIAVASVQVRNGDLLSALTFYRLDEEEPFEVQWYIDETIHGLSGTVDEWQVITDKGARAYSESGKEKGFLSFDDEPLRFFRAKGQRVSALVLGDYQEFKSVRLALLDASAQVGGAVSLQAPVEAMDVCGSRTAILANNRIMIYQEDGRLYREIIPETEVLSLALGKNCLYYITPESVCQENLI